MTIQYDFAYDWDEEQRIITLSGISDFDLKQTLECGQCFRWNRQPDGSYIGVAHSRVIAVRQQENKVYIENSTLQDFLEIWIQYFDLSRDYGKIKKLLSEGDPIMKRVISFGSGIRLLRQDEWESLISFIISQNANIPRIKKCIESLCSTYGEALPEFKGETYYTFPEPSDLIKESRKDIGICRLGYREDYILKTAGQIAEDAGETLYQAKHMDKSDAEKYLLSLCGVGPKVANCVSLFALSFLDSFPIDVWMRRVMNQLYGLNENDLSAMAVFARSKFGNLGGFAQQYLFYYAREKKEKDICSDL